MGDHVTRDQSGTGTTTRDHTRQRRRRGRHAQRTRGLVVGVARTASGDVYAGRDGNVYKKEGDGWQKYDGGGNWNSVQPTNEQRQQAQQRAAGAQDKAGAARSGAATSDSATMGQLNRIQPREPRVRSGRMPRTAAARERVPAYRPSGGGARRGGGRR